MNRTGTERPRAKLFVRLEPETGLESRKEDAVERVVELDDRGAIADYDVFTWGKEIRPRGPLEEVPYYRTLLDHVDELQQWIDEAGVVDCGFDHRDVTSTVTGEEYDVVTLPAICLAVYEQETLTEVYPRCDGGELETVVDGLRSLERVRIAVDG